MTARRGADRSLPRPGVAASSGRAYGHYRDCSRNGELLPQEAASGQTSMTETLTLPPDPSSVPQGRHFVQRLLFEWGLSALVEPASLLTSELLTNSVLHARTPITLTVTPADGCVDIVVRDGSPLRPTRRRHSLEASTGRGIELLELLATSWEVVADGAGKSIRFTVSKEANAWADVGAEPRGAGDL